jgi:hypothetical protein
VLMVSRVVLYRNWQTNKGGSYEIWQTNGLSTPIR